MTKAGELKSVPARKAVDGSLPRQLESVCEHSTSTLAGFFREFLDNIDDKLFDQAEGSTDAERTKLLDVMRELRIQHGAIETRFRQERINSFQALLKKPQAADKKEELSLDDLALVNDEQLEVDVAVENAVRRARNACNEQLSAFNKRVAYLFESRFDVDSQNSPLDPSSLLNSFRQSIEKLEVDIRNRLVLFKLFEREVLARHEDVIADANQRLIDAGVLPQIRHKPAKSRKPSASSATGSSGSGNGAATGENTHQLFEMLQQVLASSQQATQATAGMSALSQLAGARAKPAPDNMAVMQDGVAYAGGQRVDNADVHAVASGDLISVLNRLQHLEYSLADQQEQLQASSIKEDLSKQLDSEHEADVHALDQADDDVINLISMLFDFILDDQSLPAAVKALISRLQIPLLKVAIADKNFFTTDEHPARQLLNTLARVGSEWSPGQGTDDAIYQLVEKSVYEVLDNYDLDTSLFTDLLQDINDKVARQAARSERLEARVREAEEGRARNDQAEKAVALELDKRLAGRNLPEIAVKILRQAWQHVLLLTYLHEGHDGDNWPKQLKVADAVVWSLLPHRDTAALDKLKKLSPRLMASLKRGLEQIHFDPVEVQTLLAALRQAHMELLKGQETQRQRVEPVQQPEEPTPPAVTEKANTLIGQLQKLGAGQWLETGSGEQAKRCKLAANIHAGRKLVFVDRRGIKAAEYTAIELAAKIEEDEARLIESGLLFDRALESVIGDLRGQAHPA